MKNQYKIKVYAKKLKNDGYLNVRRAISEKKIKSDT